ncbi:small basic protein [Arthrobacter sp. 1088]|uniref:hypothetical protein n=1 Tax=Arthrobacter sp. 1088 TaxID=2817768 RepID=UPI002855D413|nr:hypothetical protein [Arthrobacter sp. 1088]MDR6689055.1 small basic protein [Arthrobacter sp. 1088]
MEQNLRSPDGSAANEVEGPPLKQLALINDEVLRELQAASSRHDSLRTRATILVTAAGVLATLTTSNMLTPYLAIAVALTVLSGIFGMLAIWPRKRHVANPSKSFNERLSADIYSTLYSITVDNREELRATFEQNDKVSGWLRLGFLLLLASWAATSIVIGIRTLT